MKLVSLKRLGLGALVALGVAASALTTIPADGAEASVGLNPPAYCNPCYVN